MARRLLLLLFAAVALLLSACEVRGVVEIDVAEDTSGVVSLAVSLDDDAVARAGDLAEQLQVQDMTDAGWTVTAPVKEDDGLTWIRAQKSFASADQLGFVAEETGVLADVTVARERSFANTDYTFAGAADISGGIEQFGDDALAAQLGGNPVGIDVAALEAELGPIADLADLTVIVRMPGDVDADGAVVKDNEATWQVRLDDAGPTTMVAAASQGQASPKLWLLGAGLAVIAAIGTALYQGAQLLGSRRQPAVAAGRPRATAPAVAPAQPAAAPVRRLEMVVLDGMGVLFRTGDNVGRLLTPFAREHGSTVDDGAIVEAYRLASMGRLSTAEFWAAIEVDGDADELDRAYVDRVDLSPGAGRFLRRAHEQGLRIACLTNSVNKWVKMLRDRHALDGLVDDWLVSSNIGVRKPDSAAFEALRRASGVPFDNCLLIDDRVEHLNAALLLGMSTALFDPDAEEAPGDHRVIQSFAAFFS